MITDIGAQLGLTLNILTVSKSSQTNGFPQMMLDCKNFPTQAIDQFTLNQQKVATIKYEIKGIEPSRQTITLGQNIEKRI